MPTKNTFLPAEPAEEVPHPDDHVTFLHAEVPHPDGQTPVSNIALKHHDKHAPHHQHHLNPDFAHAADITLDISLQEQLASESYKRKIGDLNVYPGVWTALGDRAHPTNALLEACFKADAPGVQIALDAGAVVNHSGPKGRTPLHLAAMLRAPRAAVAICAMLISHRAKVDLRDEGSNTPLHFAAMNQERGVFAARLLLTFGAEGYARNAEGDTPMSIAQRNGTEALVTILRSRKPPDS